MARKTSAPGTGAPLLLEHPTLCLPLSFCTCWFLCRKHSLLHPCLGQRVPASPAGLTLRRPLGELSQSPHLPPSHLPATWCSVPISSHSLKLSSLIIYCLHPSLECEPLFGGVGTLSVFFPFMSPKPEQSMCMASASPGGNPGSQAGMCFVVPTGVLPCCIIETCATPCHQGSGYCFVN